MLSSDFISIQELLKSDIWPAAVDYRLICDVSKESDKIERAENIIDFVIGEEIKSKKFLDFGCGEGHIVKSAFAKDTSLSCGYDIVKSGVLEWNVVNGYLLTTEWEKIVDNGPFDIICVYDVLDHIENETIDSVMQKIKSVSNTETKIYVRCHPWCGRHAGHLYNQINKAFMHVVFTDDELNNMGYHLTHTTKTIHPLALYEKWFTPQMNIMQRDITENPVEAFFKNTDIIRNRIISHWKDSPCPIARQWPDFQLKQSFVDYILKL